MFVDEAHVAKISTALWSRSLTGAAAAMIGAGFSLNADPALASAQPMPTWTDLVRRMARELHPGGDEQAISRRDEAEKSAGATSGALRIAQEYQAQFGREALNKMISDHVPDQRFIPGALHRSLLELPWADVMTTNWDTLIERAAPLVEDRVYHIVHNEPDIATARAPRIVKLHGTLPSHRPFIFTEEDFRTYPERFPAFVNLARQITMENSLVLLGFSGEDPNFLYWSGWVRDNLGEHAPTIYLVGSLDLSPSRRKMLEDRRVQPIDLVHLPGYVDWPTATRHGQAIRWFLDRLQQARPYRRARWPTLAPPKSPVAADMTITDWHAPRDVPYSAENSWTPEYVASVLPILAHNRNVYPGWVIAPKRARDNISEQVRRHIRALPHIIGKLTPQQVEDLLFELNWQLEIALMPMTSEIAEPAKALIDPLIDAGNSSCSFKLRVLALSLLRDARECSDLAMFARLSGWLASVSTGDAEAKDRLAYEQILAAVDELDLKSIDQLLAEWNPASDPFWNIRKAALVAEFGSLEEADRLSREALLAIRQRTDRECEDIASWSREGFALVLRSQLLAANWKAADETKAEREIFADRQHVLSARGCDAEGSIDWFKSEMMHEPPPLTVYKSLTRLFDIGQQTSTLHLASDPPFIKRITALQALRFHEEIGRPARINNNTIANEAIRRAALWLIDIDPQRAINAMLRSAKADDRDIEKLFSRSAFSLMSDERAEQLGLRLLRNARSMLTRMASGSETGVLHARFLLALEALSRMAIRLPTLAPETFELAIAIYVANPGRFGRREKALAHLFQRAFLALPPEQQIELAPQLFDLPLPEYFDAANPTFDPVDVLKTYRIASGHVATWRRIIASLLPVVRDKKGRPAAQMRIHKLIEFDLLTASENVAYMSALWDPAFLQDGLPSETRLYSWVFAEQSPSRKRALAGIKKRLLTTTDFSSTDAMRTIIALIGGTEPSLRLARGERNLVVRSYLAWLKHYDVAGATGEMSLGGESIAIEIGQSIPIIVKMGLADKETTVETKTFFAEKMPLFGYTALPVLLSHQLISSDRALDIISPALLANDHSLASVATLAIIDWVKLDTPAAPDEIWDKIIDAIYARLPETLYACLACVRYCYGEISTRVPMKIDGRLTGALMLILEETRQDGPRDTLAYDPGLVRREGGRLIAAMHAAGRLDADAYESWRAAALAERVSEIELKLKF